MPWHIALAGFPDTMNLRSETDAIEGRSRRKRAPHRGHSICGNKRFTPMADIDHHRIDVRFVPILLQKSRKAPLIFRQRTKQAAIADQCSFKPVYGNRP